MNWVRVLPQNILSESDFIRKVNASGKKIIVVKSDDKLFAMDSKCPHAGADLSQGWCSQGNIVCPYHRHEFNMETGRGKAGQGNYINTYPVEIRADGIFVGFRPAWWKFWKLD